MLESFNTLMPRTEETKDMKFTTSFSETVRVGLNITEPSYDILIFISSVQLYSLLGMLEYKTI